MDSEFALRSLVADWREVAGESPRGLYEVAAGACAEELEQLIDVLHPRTLAGELKKILGGEIMVLTPDRLADLLLSIPGLEFHA